MNIDPETKKPIGAIAFDENGDAFPEDEGGWTLHPDTDEPKAKEENDNGL